MTLPDHPDNTTVPHICVVAHNAFAAVFPQYGQAVGGAETGAWTIARGLQALGTTRISFFVRSYQALPEDEVDGVRIVRRKAWFPELRRRVSESVERREGFPWFHFGKFRWALLWELPFLLLTRPFRAADLQPFEPDPLLQELSPDAFVLFGASADSSTVVATGEQLRIPVVLMIQSNSNLPVTDGKRDEYGEQSDILLQTLLRTSGLVCQSNYQQKRLKAVCGREASVIPPPINLEEWPATTQQGEYVLWIGRADQFHKRPKLLIELARRCPEIPFLMVMNRQDPQVYHEITNDLPSNVTHLEYVPFDRMPEVFSRARIFVSTGNPEYEGFPNVLLQAAATGVPIVSMHDYDDFLKRSESGLFCGEELARMVERIKEFWIVPPASAAARDRTRAWLAEHNRLEKVCSRLAELIDTMR